MDKLLTYKYYDTPEGEDILYKTMAVSRYAAMAGAFYGTFDVLMYSKPQGFVNTAARMAYNIGPLVGAAAAFAVTTNVAQNIRGKNDEINYFLGGAVSGLILSAWQRAPVAAVPLAVVLGASAMVKKFGVDNGYTFFPDVVQMTKTVSSVRHDWTMAKDVENLKTWSKGSN